jgi:hypothetical protein
MKNIYQTTQSTASLFNWNKKGLFQDERRASMNQRRRLLMKKQK